MTDSTKEGKKGRFQQIPIKEIENTPSKNTMLGALSSAVSEGKRMTRTDTREAKVTVCAVNSASKNKQTKQIKKLQSQCGGWGGGTNIANSKPMPEVSVQTPDVAGS